MATEIDELAVLLAGGGYEKPDFSAGDYYAPVAGVGGAMQQHILTNRDNYSTTENLLGSLLTGLFTGGATSLSQGYQADQKKDYNSAIISALSGNTENTTGLDSKLFSTATDNAKLFNVSRALKAQEAEATFAGEIKKAQILEGIKSEAEINKELIKNPSLIKRLQALQGGIEPEPIATELTTTNRFPGEGPSLQDKYKAVIQEQIDNGVPGSAAVQAANALTAADRAALKGSVDKADEARKRASSLSELAATAEAGIEGAGKTGGFGGGARDFLSSIYATVNPEEQQQRTSQGLLDSTKPELVKMMRSPGAVSDYETKMYLGAGPNSTNTPELNSELVGKMKNIAALESNYADFLETYREERGTTVGADSLWQKYKAANPLFVKDQAGNIDLNPIIKPWQEFDFNSAGNAPTANTQSTEQTPQIPAGMKLQRNSKTGETRVVPQ